MDATFLFWWQELDVLKAQIALRVMEYWDETLTYKQLFGVLATQKIRYEDWKKHGERHFRRLRELQKKEVRTND
jgi:hypothetical protein